MALTNLKPNVTVASFERTMSIRRLRAYCWENPAWLLPDTLEVLVDRSYKERWTFSRPFGGYERDAAERLWSRSSPVTEGAPRRLEFLFLDACALTLPGRNAWSHEDRKLYAAQLRETAFRMRQLDDEKLAALATVLWSTLPGNTDEWMGPGEIQWGLDEARVGSYEHMDDRSRRARLVSSTIVDWTDDFWFPKGAKR